MQKTRLKILYVEDEFAHVALTQRALEDTFQQEFELLHAETIAAALRMAEANPDIDVILTDLRLPDGTGLDLLNKINAGRIPPAVILVTGQGDQENAVAALKAGAADYLVKQSDYLLRLPVAINNAVARNRLIREQAALREAEIKYQFLVEQTPAVVFLDAADDNETGIYISPGVESLTGYPPTEWLSDSSLRDRLLYSEDRVRIQAAHHSSHDNGTPFVEEYRIVRRDGQVVWIKENSNLIRDGGGNPLYWQGILLDITKARETEAALQRQLEQLTVLHAVTLAGAESSSEDEIIERVVGIASQIYDEVCGALLLNENGDILTPHPSYFGADVSNWREGYPLTEGVTGKCVSLGQTLRLGDVTQEPAFIEIATGARSELCIPIRVHKRIIGVFNVESKALDAFDDEDERFLNTVAGSLGAALERLRLLREEQRRANESYGLELARREQAETLQKVIASLSATLDTHALYQTILDSLAKLVDHDSASIFLEYENGEMEIVAAKGFAHPQKVVGKKLQKSAKWHDLALARKSLIMADAQTDPRFEKWAGSEAIRGWLGVPMIAQDRVIGFINLDSHQANAFSERIATLVQTFANSAAIAIENARLYDEAQNRIKEMETVNRLSSSLRATNSKAEMLDIFLDETLALLGEENGSVWLYEHLSNRLVQFAARGAAKTVKHKQLAPTEGIIAHVFQSGEVYTSPDLKNDPLIFKPNLDVILPGYGGVCIPIRSTAGTLGAAFIQMTPNRQITKHTSLLTTLAEIIGNSIHRADLFEQSQEQIRRLTALRDIDSAIASTTDLRVTLNLLMEHTLKHLNVDAAEIMVYRPELQSLVFFCNAGFNTLSPSRPLVRIGEGLAGQVVIKGRIDHVIDLKNSSEARRSPVILHEGFVTYIGVPLFVKGQIKGVFEVFHRSMLSPNAEWMQFLQTLAGQAAIAIDNAHLFDNLQRSNQELTQAYDTTLEGWARALELRDRETEGHTRRVTDLTLHLAQFLGLHDDELIDIYRGVLLHDIGKMGVPDQILKKTGPLTEAEWAEMQRHPQYAFDLLSPITYLRSALEIPYCHHEHWDGSGYPRGLKGDQIPMSARIFAVVDVWDALLSDRPYRTAWPRDKVIEYIKEVSGTILDPTIAHAFLKMTFDEK